MAETALDKWHCDWTSNTINGKKGIATAICGDPQSKTSGELEP